MFSATMKFLNWRTTLARMVDGHAGRSRNLCVRFWSQYIGTPEPSTFKIGVPLNTKPDHELTTPVRGVACVISVCVVVPPLLVTANCLVAVA